MGIITFVGQLAATISLALGVFVIVKSWWDCDSDHIGNKEENPQ